MTANPFAGDPVLWIPPTSSPVAAAAAETNPWRKTMLARIAARPTAVWLGPWLPDPAAYVRARVRAAKVAGALPVLVVYAIPPHGVGYPAAYTDGYPADADTTAYRTLIDALAVGIGRDRCVLILEPDALPQLGDVPLSQRTGRVEIVRYAVDRFSALAGCTVYLDAGNSGERGEGWVDATTMAARLTWAGIDKCRGFALNVSNFKTTAAEVAYGREVSARLGRVPFIIDTSRNGLGPRTYGTAAERTINPAGRALGDPPMSTPPDPLVDALLWVKTPGQSDGPRAGAPAAGTFDPDYAIGLAERAQWAVNPPLAAFTDDLATPDPAKWAGWGRPGITHTPGRMRVGAGAAYPANPMVEVRSLAGSSWAVCVAGVPNRADGTTQGIVQLSLDPDNALQMLWAAGRLICRARINGQIGAGDVSVPFDANVHRWWRIRESGGTIAWDTSRDGRVWMTHRTGPAPFGVRALRGMVVAGHYGNAPDPGAFTVTAINT